MCLDLTKAGFHTHFYGKAHILPPLNCYTNELTIHMCIISNNSLVCLFLGLFLGPVWHAWVLRWSWNGSGVTGQVFTWLEVATQLASKLGHQIGYYLWYLELKQASDETIWQCSVCMNGKTCHFVSPHHPQPPYTCSTGVKTCTNIFQGWESYVPWNTM